MFFSRLPKDAPNVWMMYLDDETWPHEQGGNIGKYSLRGAPGVGLFFSWISFLGGLEKGFPLSTLFVVFFFGGGVGYLREKWTLRVDLFVFVVCFKRRSLNFHLPLFAFSS